MKVSGKDDAAWYVSLRLARQGDAHQLDQLFSSWLGFSKSKRIGEIRKAIKTKEIAVAATANSRDSLSRDSLVGFVHGTVHNDPISGGPLLYITSLYVKRPFRRKRIGSSLLDLIIGRSLRYRRIEGVEVATARRAASRFYRRLGFSQYRADFGEKLVQLDAKRWTARHRVQSLKDD